MGTHRHWENDGREIPSPKPLSPSPSLVLTLTCYCMYRLQHCLVVTVLLCWCSCTQALPPLLNLPHICTLCSPYIPMTTFPSAHTPVCMPACSCHEHAYTPSMITGRQHCTETPAPWDHTGDQRAAGLGFNGSFSFMNQSWDLTPISNIVFHTSAALPTFSLLPRSPSLLSQKLFVLIKWKSKVFLNRPKP